MGHIPLVSICIPVFNCEKYIAEAIKSAINQDYQNIEVIVIDNNSTDDTVNVVKQYIPMGVKLFENSSNIGMGGNWNSCIEKSTGEFLKILPADDFLALNCISEQVKAFDFQDENISIVACARNVVSEKGNFLLKRVNNSLKTKKVIAKEDLINLVFCSATNVIGEPGAVLLRRKQALACGIFNQRVGHVIDLDYWIRILDFGNLFYMGKALVSFRVSQNSDSVKVIDRQASDVLALLQHLYKSNKNITFHLYLRARIKLQINVFLKFWFYKIFVKVG